MVVLGLTIGKLCAGTLPTPLATSISLSGLDVSYNHLSAFPPEWSDGFANASASMLQRIFVQQNQIQVCMCLHENVVWDLCKKYSYVTRDTSRSYHRVSQNFSLYVISCNKDADNTLKF